jgi:hypothetical protein
MAMMGCTHDKFVLDRDVDLEALVLEEDIPLDLGRLPALRHFKFRERGSSADNVILLDFLDQLLATSTSSSGIETLEVDIACDYYNASDYASDYVDVGCGKDLFLSYAGWSRLDNLFTSEKFVSLRKVVLSLDLKIKEKENLDLESERNLTLPYVNALFPMFRATQRTLEIDLKVV